MSNLGSRHLGFFKGLRFSGTSGMNKSLPPHVLRLPPSLCLHLFPLLQSLPCRPLLHTPTLLQRLIPSLAGGSSWVVSPCSLATSASIPFGIETEVTGSFGLVQATNETF